MPRLSNKSNDMMTRASVRSVPCPDCGAAAHRNCTGASGRARTSSHISRWQVWREARPPAGFAALTLGDVLDIVAEHAELTERLRYAEVAVLHGGNEDTMQCKRAAVADAERYLEELRSQRVADWMRGR